MSQTPETATPASTNSNASTSQAALAKRKAAAKPKALSQPKTGGRQSKQDRVLAMLHQKEGATVAAITKVTGWQPHSVRGFFAGVVRKKLKLNLVSQGTDGKRAYRIAAGKTVGPARPKGKRAN